MAFKPILQNLILVFIIHTFYYPCYHLWLFLRMYLPACLPAYYLMYPPAYLRTSSPTNHEVKYGCSHNPCCGCWLGLHEEKHLHADEHVVNAKRACRLLEQIKNKDLLTEICVNYLEVRSNTWVDMYMLCLNLDADLL